MKFFKSLITVVIILTTIINVSFSQSANTDQTTISTKTLTVKVKGVGCSTDLKMISANVEKLEGIISFTTVKQGATTSFEAKYNPSLVTEKEIYAAIEGTGGCENPDTRPYKVKL